MHICECMSALKMFKNFTCFMSPEKVFDKFDCYPDEILRQSLFGFFDSQCLILTQNAMILELIFRYYALAVEELTRGEIDIHMSVF